MRVRGKCSVSGSDVMWKRASAGYIVYLSVEFQQGTCGSFIGFLSN